jgi:hypothetical protein
MRFRNALLAYGALAVSSAACHQTPEPVPGANEPTAAPPKPSAAKPVNPLNATVSGEPVKTPCDRRAREFADANHVELGKPVLVACPTACATGDVWGSDLYTDDSFVCRTLVHAGAIPATGGTAAITFTRGQLTYVATERNGIASRTYGTWARSFYAQALDAQNHPIGAVPTVYDEHTALVACNASHPFQGAPGAVFTAICTQDCIEGTVWGSNPYTSDSSLCAAAHQAGLIKSGALRVAVTLGGAQTSFKGSTANGVVSKDYGPYASSITLGKAE